MPAWGPSAFVGSAAQLLWAVPLALWADRGSRKLVSIVSLLIVAAFVPLMGLSPNVWWFVFLYLIASIGFGTNLTVHNSYLSDAYPTEGRGRIFSWHNLSDPLSGTIGLLIFSGVVALTHDWRYGLLLALAGFPVALWMTRLREPDKGANEASHILKSSGMDLQSQQEKAPRVLLGSAMTRLLRIRSLYYELVAVAILGFASTGAPLFGNLFFHDKFHLGTAGRGEIETIIGVAGFLGLPVAYLIGDRFFRRAPQKPLAIAGLCISAYGILFVSSLYVPQLWALRDAAVPGPVGGAAAGDLHLPDPGRHGAAGDENDLLRHVRRLLPGLRRLRRKRAVGRRLRCHRRSPRDRGVALHHRPGLYHRGFLLLIGSRYVRRDITLVIEDVIERYAEGKRRQSGGAIPALQVHNLDFYYGTNQVLFDLNLEIAEGEMVALLGTNGAGKSTLLRAVSGLAHPHRGVIRIFGMNCTYLEPEQIIDQGVALLVGGKMTFPGLTVRDNLRIGGHILRRDRSGSARLLKEALDVFPELRERIDQPAGTLSGGEQQMLALARVMMTKPRLLMIDELALGLAPMTVERLMGIVRRINEEGTTVILVEQSVNRAMSLAERCFFIERGEIRFDGPTAELMRRDDLLRPVFLGTASTGLG